MRRGFPTEHEDSVWQKFHEQSAQQAKSKNQAADKATEQSVNIPIKPEPYDVQTRRLQKEEAERKRLEEQENVKVEAAEAEAQEAEQEQAFFLSPLVPSPLAIAVAMLDVNTTHRVPDTSVVAVARVALWLELSACPTANRLRLAQHGSALAFLPAVGTDPMVAVVVWR